MESSQYVLLDGKKLFYPGLSKLDFLNNDIIEKLLQIRENKIIEMQEVQFALSYYGHVSKEDSNNMTPLEMQVWLDLLKEALKNERKE